ncbi:hypothetical protein Pla123a_39050 [Posidoniimonas polymericola]|uniref:PEP-CTERM protein-sorting domain-containing protein n=1 Tax=Posidoniimonas polymericola TaxID=2528002 RepID=A0A5C5YF69_9BACT|nr:PEP-CTERM sorting domain-containing protein [Posidoniimonas polymericola]TWT73569.1 hypothetical protein Pla123a_39050 [Posidoniimonas polymericola]
MNAKMHAFCLVILSAGPASAQLHGGDVDLTVSGGKIVTGQRVYGAELGEILPNEVDEPGFDSDPGTFPAGSSVGFAFVDSLRVWDGIDFDEIAPLTMSTQFGSSLGPVTTPSTPGVVEGFALNVAADGSWHRHLDYLLNPPATNGVYLLSLKLGSSDPTIGDSEPLYLVFNQNVDESVHDAAIDYVKARVAGIPEPASVVLLAVLGAALGKRRRI